VVLPISGFLPVPLPMMIPFMGAQSLVIGKMFGEGFQYGKRKISAMPNEEFNKLTFEDMMSNAREELKASIPTINASLQDMRPLVDVVIREFLIYVNEISKTLQAVTVTGAEEIAHALGTHVPGAHPGTTPSQPQQPIPPGPSSQQPFSPVNPTPFTPIIPSQPKSKTISPICRLQQSKARNLAQQGRAVHNEVQSHINTIRNLKSIGKYHGGLKTTQDNALKIKRAKQIRINNEINALINNPKYRECFQGFKL